MFVDCIKKEFFVVRRFRNHLLLCKPNMGFILYFWLHNECFGAQMHTEAFLAQLKIFTYFYLLHIECSHLE
jgi:hypothetical protein